MNKLQNEGLALFRRFGKAFNRAAVEEILTCVTDDFVWIQGAGSEAPHGRIRRGAEELRQAMAERDGVYRDVRFSQTNLHFADNRIIGTFRATGSYVADGRALDVKGVDIYVLRDALIASKDSYWKQIT